jgi:transcriptional regulator with XRE-family HTH domain
MTEVSRPTFLRRKLGAKLRRFREEAGLTLAEAAPGLDKNRSALHRLETGETRADVHFVRSVSDFYDRFDPTLLDETREAYKRPWYQGMPNADYIDAETHAAELRQFTVIEIPDLLRSEEYQHIRPRTTCRDALEILNDIEANRIRRKRLTDTGQPLALIAVVHEAAFRGTGNDPDVWRAQLRHLVTMSALPTVTLHVIPLKHDTRHVPNSTFTVFTFPGPADPDLLYVECPTGPQHIDDQRQVEASSRTFDRLRAAALSPAASVAFIARLANTT